MKAITSCATHFAALFTAAAILVACGPPPKPAELAKLEEMRNDSYTGEISQVSPEMLGEADKYFKKASAQWQDGELERAREYAWLGQLRYKTAEAETKTKAAKARSEKARTELQATTSTVELTKVKIESANKGIASMEQTMAAVGDKNAAVAKGAVQQELIAAESAREIAKGVNAPEFASGEFNKGEATLKIAREHLDAGRLEEATKNSREAKVIFEAATTAAKPEFAKTKANARVTELFDAAQKKFATNAIQDSRGTVVIIPAAFDRGKTAMHAGKLSQLESIAEIAAAFPETTVMVEGYTQSKGSDSKNLTVSQTRADAARDYLIQKGVDVSRTTSTGYGEEKPRYDNKDRDERDKNDRVEVILRLKK